MRPFRKSRRLESSVIHPAKQIGKTRERSISLGGSWAKRWRMFPTEALISGTPNSRNLTVNHRKHIKFSCVTYQALNCLVWYADTSVLPLGRCLPPKIGP